MDGVAMMSDLPDHILRLILSRLPSTEEVHRTSILSKRWRYLWTSIPSIDTDYARQKHRKDKRDMFEEFVYWVLATKSSDLDSFRLCYPGYYDVSTVEQWIRIAVMRRVKVVDLMICRSFWREKLSMGIELPHCLVSCGSLEVLRLDLVDNRLTLPLFNGFRALRVIELNRVKLTDGGLLQHFLEQSCPSLEELSFTHCILYKLRYLSISCPKLKKLRIDNRNTETDIDRDGFLYSGVWISCPKLVFLELGGHVADSFSLKSLDSLKKAVIHPEEDLHEYKIFYNLRGESISSLFAQISHAEFMSLSHYFIKELDVPVVSPPNLKTLELTTTLDAYVMDVLIKFVLRFQHLESLHLIIREVSFTNKHWSLDNAEARRILGACLKKVEFLQFKGERRKLPVVRSLLKHGNVLEKMVFNWHNYYPDKSIKTMKKVSKFPKASSTVKLITLINESTTKV